MVYNDCQVLFINFLKNFLFHYIYEITQTQTDVCIYTYVRVYVSRETF